MSLLNAFKAIFRSVLSTIRLVMFNLLGSVNAFFILFSLLGVYAQLQTIQRRKVSLATRNSTTELLSQNQFSVSFLAYFSFFVYGYSIAPFNHFIVWPRLLASVLVGIILYEIWRDRRNLVSRVCFFVAAVALIAGMAGMLLSEQFTDESHFISTSLIVSVTILIAQGYYHQIMMIIRSGKTGAVDLRMSQFILMMDVSTIAFALSMGLEDGWPLLLLATVSGITKLVIMYLFRWVKVSRAAYERREVEAR